MCITIFSLKTPQSTPRVAAGRKTVCQIVLMSHNRHRRPTLTRPRICVLRRTCQHEKIEVKTLNHTCTLRPINSKILELYVKRKFAKDGKYK
ncbi:hypothetical protein HanRHA438_Chr11g0531831 [Helianthus annuus]|nr:hypothetical protein HanRHA438_Chr11g0531831 [Helianthus annuus]